MRCPACALESDLVSESQAESLGIDPVRGALPPGVDPWEAPPEEDLEEIPCPACAAPILVAPDESEGYCPHCAAELEFEHVDDDEAGGEGPATETDPGAEGRAPEDPHPEVHEEASASPVPAFDPTLEITPDNAPLVECAPVAPARASEAAEDPVAGPGTADAETPADEEVDEEAGSADGDDAEADTDEDEEAGADDGDVKEDAAEVPDEPAPEDPDPEVHAEAGSRAATPPFDPTLEVTAENAPLVECAPVTPSKEAEGGPDDAPGDRAQASASDEEVAWRDLEETPEDERIAGRPKSQGSTMDIPEDDEASEEISLELETRPET